MHDHRESVYDGEHTKWDSLWVFVHREPIANGEEMIIIIVIANFDAHKRPDDEKPREHWNHERPARGIKHGISPVFQDIFGIANISSFYGAFEPYRCL